MQDKGYDYDLNRDIYESMKGIKMRDLEDFHSKYIKGKPFTFLILGDKSQIDMDYLSSLGEVTELSLEEVFGY